MQDKMSQFEKHLNQKYKIIFNKNKELQNIKCNGKLHQQVYRICISPKCHNYPFICIDQLNCNCRSTYHSTCNFIHFTQFINYSRSQIKNTINVANASDKKINQLQKKVKQYLEVLRFTNQSNISKKFIPQDLLSILQNIQQCKYGQGFKQSLLTYLNEAKTKASDIDETDFEFNLKTSLDKLNSNISFLTIQNQAFCQLYGIYNASKILQKVFLKDPLKQLFQNKQIIDRTMIYQASQNKFSVDQFYNQCEGINNVILLVKTQAGKIIGGFTPLAWKSTESLVDFVKDQSKQTFIFSLTENVILRQQNSNAGIANSNISGPQFATNQTYVFLICSGADTQNGSCLVFNNSFIDSQGIFEPSNPNQSQLYQRFTGSTDSFFLVQQWEIWQLQFKK